MKHFEQIRLAAPLCVGYMVDRLTLSQIDETDALDIGLRWGPAKPDIILSFQDVYYFEIGRLPGPGAEPLDDVTATVLPPADEPWPAQLHIDTIRSAALPPLLWFRAEGPVQLNVVAAIANAFVELSPDDSVPPT
ncbi:hypothetical protein [Nocardia paucivorans]|uniref:hypothetical protein n=1 Tax=Nocardia paucivorans TaxID=114259 RepID=UPI0002E6C293|nr:hypothetical protein [Nocardia paucivorans]